MLSNHDRLDDSENMQMVMLKISHLYFTKVFQQLADTSVHPGQLPMIKLLGESDGLSQHEIAAKLQIKPPTVNVSIKRMEKAGLVERKISGENYKKSKIFLTLDGIRFHEKIGALMRDNEKALLQGFTESEICLIKRFYKQMIINLEAMPIEMRKEMKQ